MDTTKRATPVLAVVHVEREPDKPRLVLRPPIVYVLKMYVHVPMVSLLPVQLAHPMVATFVLAVELDFTKMPICTTPVLAADPVAREQDKKQLVLRHLIVDVLKMYVPVPTV